jgi:hypothetical protein
MNMVYTLSRRAVIVLEKIQPRGFSSLVDGRRYFLGRSRTGLKVFFRNFEKSRIMPFWKDQSVARVDRIYVQKADHEFVFVDFRAGKLSRYYPAKNTVSHIMSPRQSNFERCRFRKILADPAARTVVK